MSVPSTRTSTSWHAAHADDVAAELGVEPGRGLDDAEVAASRARHGRNELTEAGRKSPITILAQQFTSVLVLILLAAAGLSLALGKLAEAVAILAIVVLFALLGFAQEYRAERAIAALKAMSSPTVRVRRSGRMTEVPAPEVVVGDVVALEAGSVVPADLRLTETAALRISEAALTGEAEPVDKSTAPVDDPDAPLGDRSSMAYMGTAVTYGRGEGLVTAVGMDTELGRIAGLLASVTSEATPLQRKLDRVGKGLAVFGLAVAVLVGLIGLAGGEGIDDVLLTSISTMVAVVPEGLPAVVTLTLALGSQRMLRRNALIRRLPAVETLGSVTTICSDKTGTLTENRMTVTTIDVAGHRFSIDELVEGGHLRVDPAVAPHPVAPALHLTLLAGALANDATVTTRPEDGTQITVGDPTEAAMVVSAMQAGIDVDAERARLPRRGEVPFDSDRKRMTTVHPLPPEGWSGLAGSAVAFTKGAVDGLVELSTRVWVDGEIQPLDDDVRRRILTANHDLAAGGMRVLGVGLRPLDDLDTDDVEQDLVFCGMVGILDPPRPEVAAAVERCRTAGIRPVMITGDHPVTALAIARELGIPAERAVTGAEVEAMDPSTLAATVGAVSVFARVSPEHKLRIVDALSTRGEVVAMTGDGVNDAPALRQADIGVAMGITGTDVSKEAADMVLRDDNFSTIVAAVEEGRVIYDNLRRFVSFAVAGNIGKVAVMLAWPLALLATGAELGEAAVALLPLQLLWLNLMTDGILGLSLGAEPAEPDVMQRSPVPPGSGIFSGGLGRHTMVVGTLIGALTLAVGTWYLAADGPWQTMMFTTVAVLQVFQAFAVRSHRTPSWRLGLFANRALLAAVAGVAALQVVAVTLPGLSDTVLDLEPLAAADWAVVLAVGVGFVILAEAWKWTQRRGPVPA